MPTLLNDVENCSCLGKKKHAQLITNGTGKYFLQMLAFRQLYFKLKCCAGLIFSVGYVLFFSVGYGLHKGKTSLLKRRKVL
jgi:hypothetical protein